AAVNTAFEEVELLLRDLAPVPNASVVEKTHSTRELAQLAQKHGKISPVDERAISVLRFFRDTVAGSSETLSYTSALEFLIFADGVMATLEERRE
ncbi:MAG TPA: hypothetical protein VFQ77_19700, partial [Pseudonocardiaceae bacterium]|nr:hypothetical protein [Pseudonocardiaceae bacterium]